MKARDLRDLSDAELREGLLELNKEKLHLAGAFAIGVPPEASLGKPNTALLRNIRHNTARILTIIRERELGVKR